METLSSMMRTTRLLTISRSIPCISGGEVRGSVLIYSIVFSYSSPPLLEMMCSRHTVMVCLNCQTPRRRQRPIKMACRILCMRSYNSETETDANFTGFCKHFISTRLGVGQCEWTFRMNDDALFWALTIEFSCYQILLNSMNFSGMCVK